MKGPYERLKYDFRRLWECPRCGHRAFSGGEGTSMLCECTLKESPPRRTVMLLAAEGGRRVGPLPPGVTPFPPRPAPTPPQEQTRELEGSPDSPDGPSPAAPSPAVAPPLPDETAVDSPSGADAASQERQATAKPLPGQSGENTPADSQQAASGTSSSSPASDGTPQQRGRRSKSKRRRKRR